MKTILNTSVDPYFNLALEEYVLKNIDCEEDILLLWVNAPAVILGRNQVVYGEVNVGYCEKHGIPILRRISGGGTVYHDLGNLNFSIISKHYQGVLRNYQVFTQPVIDFLQTLGVDARFSGKSDLVIGKEKFSGNAQMYHQKKMLHHGTILFNTKLDTLTKVLKPKSQDIDSIGVDSNRSRVTNIMTHLNPQLTIEAFKSKLLNFWLNTDDALSHVIVLTEADIKAIEDLKQNKYHTWAWTYGESPNFEIKKAFEDKQIVVSVKEGLIDTLMLTTKSINLHFNQFMGVRFDKKIYVQVLETIDESLRISLTPFTNLLFE